MKYLFTVMFLLLISILSFSQDKKIDTMPGYEGGIESFYDYIRMNIRYPQVARSVGEQGLLYVSFEIDSVRGIQNVQVYNDKNYYFGMEINRVLAECPNHWKLKGSVARVVLPVNFKFDKGNDAILTKPTEIPEGTLLSPIVVVGYGK